jgi:hypothetical protein
VDEPRDYGSHLPVLRALLAQLQPHNVLEYGAGLFSTPEFLRRDELVRLISVEPDAAWRSKVAKACKDPRLVLRSELHVDPNFFDLILIDNGECMADRLEVIRYVLSRPHPIVVIHDADVAQYAAAIKELAIYHTTVATDPPTAVVWS